MEEVEKKSVLHYLIANKADYSNSNSIAPNTTYSYVLTNYK